ncbi:helix-turn-helix domain-containing protein [Paenibacillus sediminis]|uniref:DNA-binding transcriptional MerR regulator n=1 Tax=Paenibacillus sediminis TaxID=664909 RepID=A0ABS4H8V8_9BACL|nr:helix-turn-helix domain-containing protein [Paenibacillus sediminis]MBP1938500.1 DNA-binding transcriptional MerR regulator [Paenibacillus sediminis]
MIKKKLKKGIEALLPTFDEMLSINEAAEELGVSEQRIHQYIERGLNAVDDNGVVQVPRSILEEWKDPTFAFEMQWIHQNKQLQNRILEVKLEYINKQIASFEEEYQGTFYQLTRHLSESDIDGLDEAVDFFDWRDFEEQKKRLLPN